MYILDEDASRQLLTHTNGDSSPLPCEWEMELQIAVPSLGESQLGGRQLRRKGIHELM